jgi:hypothetical protein
MQQARFPSRCLAPLLGVILAGEVVCTVSGCHQHYYYYGNPPCSPCSPAPNTVQYGSVCDVPTQVVEGGTTLSDSSGRSTTVTGTKNSTRVVVSEPTNPSPFSWRKSDPEASMATTSVEGAATDSTINR